MNEGPHKEKQMARATLRSAVEMAQSGRAPEGLRRLSAGLERMEMLASLGLPWAQELTQFYRQAIGLYRRAYRPQARAELSGAQAGPAA